MKLNTREREREREKSDRQEVHSELRAHFEAVSERVKPSFTCLRQWLSWNSTRSAALLNTKTD